MRLPGPLLAILAVALAGCASDAGTGPSVAPPTAVSPAGSEVLDEGADATEGEGAEGEAPAPPRVEVAFTNGTITTVGTATGEPVSLCCPSVVVAGDGVNGAFTPEAGLTGIAIELAWTDPTFDLDLFVFAPDYEDVFPPVVNGTSIEGNRGHGWFLTDGGLGSPGGRVVFLQTDPEILALEGEWSWSVSGKTGSNVAFTVATSLFYGGQPDAAYTALAV